MQKNRHRLRRWLVIGSVVTIGVLGLVIVALWLMVAHIPSWYEPPHVPELRYEALRKELLATYSQFSDDLVAGQPFEITLTDRQISEWIAIRSETWPESEEWIPPFLHDPVVAFQPGRIIAGARLDHDGWQVIVSAHVLISVADDEVTVRLDKVAGGSMPIPVAAVMQRLNRVLTAPGQDVDAMPDAVAQIVRFFRNRGAVDKLTRGAVLENRFRWQNGKRWFRLRDLTIEPGQLRIEVEPLSTGRSR
jgi:hypothetical protein